MSHTTGQFRVTLFAETVVWRQSSSKMEFVDEVIHVHSKVDVQLEWRTMFEAERLRTAVAFSCAGVISFVL